MEKSSEFVGERSVSEVGAPTFNERDRARDLIKEIAGHCWGGAGDMVDRVYDAVRRVYPKARWTRRRIRSFWHREAAKVGWSEVRELEVVAAVERRRRDQIEQAKADHAEFVTRIGATLDRLAASDADFHREHMDALRSMAGKSPDQAGRQSAGEGASHTHRRGRFLKTDYAGDFR
jgi:hypothetical protein